MPTNYHSHKPLDQQQQHCLISRARNKNHPALQSHLSPLTLPVHGWESSLYTYAAQNKSTTCCCHQQQPLIKTLKNLLELSIISANQALKRGRKKRKEYHLRTQIRGSLEIFTFTIKLDASSNHKNSSLTSLKPSAHIVMELPGFCQDLLDQPTSEIHLFVYESITTEAHQILKNNKSQQNLPPELGMNLKFHFSSF